MFKLTIVNCVVIFLCSGFTKCNVDNTLEDAAYWSNWVTASTLYATIPKWGRTFGVTFLLWIEAYPSEQPWAELVRFTSTEGNCCSQGDRIPAIFLHKDGFIYICSQIGTQPNRCQRVNVDLQSWTLVELTQDHEGNKVILNISICIAFHLILFLVVL